MSTPPHPTTLLPYSERIERHSNPTARRLLTIMDRKKTNLCVSVDVNKAEEALEVVRRVGASCCMVKTHCDIIEDFTMAFTEELVRLGQELDFVIFEDRKFADIGNTVTQQYSSGIYKIASWSDLTNAHPLPGPGIITGLSSIGLPLGRGLLLLAEMSSKGNMAVGDYTAETVKMARDVGRGFVVGFIAMGRVDVPSPSHGEDRTGTNGPGKGDGDMAGEESEEEDYLICTPGVGLVSKNDKMGQQYRTPQEVIYDSGCDVMIVGRGIYGVTGGAVKVKEEAERYRVEGWRAYEERLGRR